MAVQVMHCSSPVYIHPSTIRNPSLYHPTPPLSFTNDTILKREPIPNTTVQSSTVWLAAFASDLEKDITNKVLKQLNLNQHNPNNVILVTVCKLIDDVTENINNNMSKLSNNFKKSFAVLSKQQQQIIEHNSKCFDAFANKLNDIEHNNKRIEQLVNMQNQCVIDKQHNNYKKLDLMQKQLQKMSNQMSNINKIDKKIGIMQKQIAIDIEVKTNQLTGVVNDKIGLVLNKVDYNQALNDKCGKKLDHQICNIKTMNEVLHKQIQKMNHEFNTIIEDNQNSALSTVVAMQNIKFEVKQLKDALHQKQLHNIVPTKGIDSINSIDLNVRKELEQLKININNNSSSLNTFIGGFYTNMKCILHSELSGNGIKSESKLNLMNEQFVKLNQNLIDYSNIDLKQLIKNQKIILNNIRKLGNTGVGKGETHLKTEVNNLISSINTLFAKFPSQFNDIGKNGIHYTEKLESQNSLIIKYLNNINCDLVRHQKELLSKLDRNDQYIINNIFDAAKQLNELNQLSIKNVNDFICKNSNDNIKQMDHLKLQIENLSLHDEQFLNDIKLFHTEFGEIIENNIKGKNCNTSNKIIQSYFSKIEENINDQSKQIIYNNNFVIGKLIKQLKGVKIKLNKIEVRLNSND